MRLPVTFHHVSGANYIYVDSYKEWLSHQKLTPNTLRSYYSRVKQFLTFIEYARNNNEPIGDAPSLKEAGCLYIRFLKQSKKSNVTVNSAVNALNNFCCFLGMNDVRFERQRGYIKPASLLTATELERFFKSVEQEKSKRDKALVLVIFYSGLRLSDCARLNIENIGPAATCICLGADVRLPLNQPTQFALKQWLEECRQQISTANPQQALWLTKQGRRLSIAGITFVIKRIGCRAKLKLSAEMLRRTYLTKLRNQPSTE